MCIEEGIYPDSLKIARVVPVFKGGNKNLTVMSKTKNNFRQQGGLFNNDATNIFQFNTGIPSLINYITQQQPIQQQIPQQQQVSLPQMTARTEKH